jgi:hypothetical protein
MPRSALREPHACATSAREPLWAIEQFDDRARKARKFAQSRIDWLAAYDASIAERYLNADLNLVVRVGKAPYTST